MFSPAVAGMPTRVYSPNLITGKVDVIDPETFKVIDSLEAMPSPEHIVPSWDLQTLWVSADVSMSGGHGGVIADRPENRQDRARKSTFPTPTTCISRPTANPRSSSPRRCGGSNSAIRIRWSCRAISARPHCAGINHADFSPDGAYAIFTCEFNDSLAKIDLVHHKLADTLPLTPGHMPQDIRVAPDGKTSSSPTFSATGSW